jgi:hypothetical protein
MCLSTMWMNTILPTNNLCSARRAPLLRAIHQTRLDAIRTDGVGRCGSVLATLSRPQDVAESAEQAALALGAVTLQTRGLGADGTDQ